VGKHATAVRGAAIAALGLGLSLGLSLACAAPVSAQVYVGVPVPSVGATDTGAPVQTIDVQAPVAPPGQFRVLSTSFAVTGADIVGMVGLAAGASSLGVVLVRAGRRRDEDAEPAG